MVCGANYCYDCVLRAMGSMPEGRKCVTCVGFRIREARRGKLGKCSRLLKRLLTDWEVKNIMNVEMLCEVNQLPPELVVVNGETISQDELFRLKHCKFPPKKLGPGYYWYDKTSGFWGKVTTKNLLVHFILSFLLFFFLFGRNIFFFLFLHNGIIVVV